MTFTPISEQFGIFKNQIDDFFDFFEMIRRRIYHERIEIQIVLKIVSAESAVRIQKHFQQTMNPVYRVERILAVSQSLQIS